MTRGGRSFFLTPDDGQGDPRGAASLPVAVSVAAYGSVLGVLAINLKSLLIGASLEPVVRGPSLWHKVTRMHWVADENWAVAVAARRRCGMVSTAYLLGGGCASSPHGASGPCPGTSSGPPCTIPSSTLRTLLSSPSLRLWPSLYGGAGATPCRGLSRPARPFCWRSSFPANGPFSATPWRDPSSPPWPPMRCDSAVCCSPGGCLGAGAFAPFWTPHRGHFGVFWRRRVFWLRGHRAFSPPAGGPPWRIERIAEKQAQRIPAALSQQTLSYPLRRCWRPRIAKPPFADNEA